MKKPVKVHRLPTEEESSIFSKWDELYYTPFDTSVPNPKTSGKNQHLYFTSGEEPKEGKWCIHLTTKEVVKYPKGGFPKGHSRKIVATTDKSLTQLSPKRYVGYLGQELINLPQIPQQFQEEYVKVGGIDEVYLEYITNNVDNQEILFHEEHKEYFFEGYCNGIYSSYNRLENKLKTDQNNCVIIHPVEPKLYTREEVTTLLIKSRGEIAIRTNIKDWIKENLK